MHFLHFSFCLSEVAAAHKKRLNRADIETQCAGIDAKSRNAEFVRLQIAIGSYFFLRNSCGIFCAFRQMGKKRIVALYEAMKTKKPASDLLND